ncbi:NADH:flavin oxidoreductase [Halobacteriovorax sp. HLS]|uniref:NADH:flavin oxidoreductase n=1 Tax=Halobacteriovorax sp. HLS TaxID=2234000 RepID=UPI000FDC0FCD|nr:NADH:flavin oxidoreductase [Halobacteriovorax sp. HLS]
MININSELQIKNSVFKNRVIVPPMASQTADELGYVTNETLNHYHRLATSDASLVLVEYSYVSLDGKSEPKQLGIDSYEKVMGLRQLSNMIKQTRVLAGIQLVHAGAKSTSELTGGKLIAPSPISTPVKGQELEIPLQATLADIEKLKKDFIRAAKIAVHANFDVIEIHAAHGYGINQWLSPITNQRTDQYGGTLYNRARILFEIVSEIRALFPKLIISVRIPGQDHFENGTTTTDSILISKKLVYLGVDIINVSSGIGGWRRPRDRRGEGYLVEDARRIQKHINAPVIGVGGIKTKKYIEENLQNKSFSFAAIGRAILENPIMGKQLLTR